MAPKAFLITIVVATFSATSMAANYNIGDVAGWKVGVNYTEWAAGKNFFVGDRLTFKYDEGSHNVLRVNGVDFQNCTTSNRTGLLTSGSDVITLASAGRKWYICAVGDHCSQGMKLLITVSEAAAAPGPGPMLPTPGSSGASEIKSFGRMVAALSIFNMILA